MEVVNSRFPRRYRVIPTDVEAIDNAAIHVMRSQYQGCDKLVELMKASVSAATPVLQWMMCLDTKTNVWVGLLAYTTTSSSGLCRVAWATLHISYRSSGIQTLFMEKLKKRIKRIGCASIHIDANYASVLASLSSSSSRITKPIGEDQDVPRVSAHIDITYFQRLASALVERRPRLSVWFSTDFCDVVAVKNLGESHGFKTRVELEANVFKVYLPRDLRLNFQVFVDVRNDGDEWCGNQAGSFSIPWSDVSAAHASERDYIATHDLLISTNKNFKKGSLKVRIRRDGVQFTGVDNIDPRALYVDPLQGGSERVHKKVISIIDKAFQTFHQLRPSFKSIENIHAYIYQTAADRILPAAAFDIPLARPSCEQFYLNILGMVLNRYDQTLEWFMREASAQEMGRVVTEMSTVYVNWCKYIPDLVYESVRGNAATDKDVRAAMRKVQNIESFDCVASRGAEENQRIMREDPSDASDCEDFAKAILEFLFMLRVGKWKSMAMARVKANCRLWYNFAVLGGVSNAKLDAHDLKTLSSMNAHEYVIRIPKALFWSWMRDAKNTGLAQVVGESEKQLGTGLKPLVAEGTGLLYPDETDDPGDAMRKVLDTKYRSHMTKLKKRYKYKRGVPGTFYQICTTAFTPDFLLDGVPYLEFVFVQKKMMGGYTYGVQFTDVSAANPRVRLLPQNPLMRSERQLVKAVLKDLYPTPSLLPPTDDQMRVIVNNEFVRILTPYMAAEQKSSRQQHLADPGVVTAFIRRGDATPEKAREIAHILRAEGARVLLKPELVTSTGVGGYVVIFIFNH